MKKYLIAVLLCLAAVTRATAGFPLIQDYAAGFVEVSFGSPLEAENVKPGHFWEVRAGQVKYYGDDVSGTASWGFSNYESNDVVSAVDRLVPGDLSLRTLNFENDANLKVSRRLSVGFTAGIGWTWIGHSPARGVGLADLDPYGEDDKLVAVSERVHDNFSATFKAHTDYEVGDGIQVGFSARYMMLNSFRERSVTLYDESSTAAYNDRYYIYHTESPISFDHWTLAAAIKFLF